MKRKIAGGLWEFFKSFSALNVVLLAGLAGWLASRGELTPDNFRQAVAAFEPEEAPPEEAIAPPDLKGWELLGSNEEREAFLQAAYDKLQEDRARVLREVEVLDRRRASEKASLEALRAEVERARTGLAQAEKKFEARRKEWEGVADEASFADQVQIYQNIKEDELATLLLARRGAEGDWYIVRVLQALTAANPRKVGKLVAAMKAETMGGEARVNAILDRWRAAEVPEAPPEEPEKPKQSDD